MYFMDKMQAVMVNFNKIQKKQKIYKKKESRRKINTSALTRSIPVSLLKDKKAKFYEFRKQKRIKEMQLDEKINLNKNNYEKNFEKNLKNFQRKSLINSTVIKDQLKGQTDNIKQKLKRRRDKSMSKSIERSFVTRKNRMLAKSVLMGKGKIVKGKKEGKGQGILKELERFERNVGECKVDRNFLFD